MVRDGCAFIFTEIWLHKGEFDHAIQLPGLTMFQVYRIASLSGKTHGGGLCVYINNE